MANRKEKRRKYLDKINGICNPVLIETWEELFKCTSPTHIIEAGNCCGHVWRKERESKEYPMYLSTHTFYNATNEYYTKELQKRGFNVIIDNWDKGKKI